MSAEILTNIISIGDSDIEIAAAYDMASCFE